MTGATTTVGKPPGADLVLTEPTNWAAYSHPQLYLSVHANLDPGVTSAVVNTWARLGADMGESATRFATAVRDTESGWEGEAASTARSSMTALADWGAETAATAVTLSVRLDEQGSHAERARSRMPEPVQFDWDSVLSDMFGSGNPVGLFIVLQDLKRFNDLARDAHDQAVEVMVELETNSRTIDAAMPVFALPPNVLRTTLGDAAGSSSDVDGLGGAGGGSEGRFGAGSGGGGGGFELPGGGQGMFAGDLFEPGAGADWTPPTLPPREVTSAAAFPSPVQAYVPGAGSGVGAAAFAPGLGGGPQSFAAQGFAVPEHGGIGSGVGGGAGFGPTGARVPVAGFGQARQGFAAPVRPGDLGAGVAAGRGGQAGSGLPGFAGGGGGGAKGEEDEERGPTPYVQGESIFDDEQRVPPPVIGVSFKSKSWVRE
ncbi:PPE domain-containing protein [Actinokineospora cianjurensis]|uniref:PPE domain-containing protein n=1 Tax=Actinokineospora cianjurensis TaxID=585224 RepID=A0A421AVA3_9PSEU|nr:hypothetical protein [Actinokineospora cianjurensis]RLK54015.1 hypothetical protein CLV68_6016 [Actinokineospora cianjurensis]